jgi:hypothetical protein
VSLAGLDYPLDHEVLPVDACLGLGNHVSVTGAAAIDVHEGMAAIIVEADEPFRRRPQATDAA